MAMALPVARSSGRSLVFEADGFMADERVDFGGWHSRGLPYRVLRAVEAAGVRRARAVICRTEAARDLLLERAGGVDEVRPKIFVAPNAKDARLFMPGTDAERAETRRRQGIGLNVPWVVYVGSIGPQYCPEAMLQTFECILRRTPQARLSCFTMHEERLSFLLSEQRISPGAVRIGRASPSEVPAILAASDLGLALRLQAPSQRGICPIKVAEYLLCGVPVLTSHVGDLQEQLGRSAAALVVDPASAETAERAANWFVESVLPERAALREAARQLGLQWFELTRSIDTYASMLRFHANQDEG
jgi:glycosyltransferase involved in cell wall biosynthesis